MLTLMCTFAASRKANIALKLMLHVPCYLACWIRWFLLFSRQWHCFFLNSGQDVSECNLLKLDLFTTYIKEMVLYVYYIYLKKVQKEEPDGRFEQEAGLDHHLRPLPASVTLWAIRGSSRILVPPGDNELTIHFWIKVGFKSSMKWVHWS